MPGLFFVFLIVQLVDKILPMSGFKLGISGVRSNRSTNRATATATWKHKYSQLEVRVKTQARLKFEFTGIVKYFLRNFIHSDFFCSARKSEPTTKLTQDLKIDFLEQKYFSLNF